MTSLLPCRECHIDDEIINLVSPCQCKGRRLYIHAKCLESKIKEGIYECVACQQPYNLSNDNTNHKETNHKETNMVTSLGKLVTMLGVLCLIVVSYVGWHLTKEYALTDPGMFENEQENYYFWQHCRLQPANCNFWGCQGAYICNPLPNMFVRFSPVILCLIVLLFCN